MKPSSNITDPAHTADLSELKQVLAYHDGNANAAIDTLLNDCRYLRDQLSIARATMSIGFTRGWLPSTDRD
jgi:hypothetical protein